jgi:S-DNA-T family DNA segregation ATPase FtsK/SpoIIIE
MNFLSPTRHTRLNEAVGFLLLLLSLAIWLSLLSYSSTDPSWNTAAETLRVHNLLGRNGAVWSDIFLQIFGLSIFLLPIHLALLGWKWVRNAPVHAAWFRISGSLALWFCLATACALLTPHWLIGGAVRPSGVIGMIIADFLRARFDLAGAAIITAAAGIVALYFATTFEVAILTRLFGGTIAKFRARWEAWRVARAEQRARSLERAKAKAAERAARRNDNKAAPVAKTRLESTVIEDLSIPSAAAKKRAAAEAELEEPPFDMPVHDLQALEEEEPEEEDIPIRQLVDQPAVQNTPAPQPGRVVPFAAPHPKANRRRIYELPSTDLLNEAPAGNGYDTFELKEVAGKIKSKLEEFNVRGSVVQINPGPVVTTFEYKPEAGIKYSRITTLMEDLCLGLQAESVLIERLPGKSTVGIEVPNSRREVISFRGILESSEFIDAVSRMTIALGKDINGRIKVASLETMPHLLIAGSTGSGKSVMLNAMIMSFLYKATPDEVKMIMVDPKRVELGIYEGIPHLLTPVITEPKKATNALRNAVLEMERRLKLLAGQGVRNIDQYNRKMAQLRAEPRSLFDEAEDDENLRNLPYILILIDELADLMMLERANVEECITRLAQMARAVGMHLVLATQRPSVDVITGLIKANFPSRISFRVATRVDSRTVLDSMGAEHLLGKGDMLFLPPGSSRLTRVHGAYVSEVETNRVVDFWKAQAQPEYDESFLIASA